MSRQYLDFKKLPNGNLKITLTELGREEFPELLLNNYGEDSSHIMHELMEYQLGNGWESLSPEEIGAMTNCDLILTDEIVRSEDGEDILELGRVYWHNNYMVEDTIELLQENGLILIGVTD